MSNIKQLFKEFNKVSEQEWVAKIEKDLKGKPLSLLDYQPELGIKTRAYFHSDNAKNYQPLNKNNNNAWFVQEHFSGNNSHQLNQTILNHLLVGCDAIQVEITSQTDLKQLLNDVGLQYISSEFILTDTSQFNQLKDVLKNKYNHLTLAFDVLTIGINKGEFNYTLNDFLTYYNQFSHYKIKHLHVDGLTFGQAGASTIQELAFALAQLSEYVQTLLNNGIKLKEIVTKTYTTLSINEEYFTNIAKFRAYKILLNHFFKSFDKNINVDETLINATTNQRHLAKNDRYNNLLRATTQAMSAILGGAKNIQVTPFDSSDEIAVRMARNIQLILKEEAYFDKVSDPAAGAYYIEDLTDKLVNSAWDLFLEIENNGGYISSIKDNFIQNKINNNKTLLIDNLNNNTKTFLGVNKYPSTLESWIEVKPEQETPKDFKPFSKFILEQHYQKPTE